MNLNPNPNSTQENHDGILLTQPVTADVKPITANFSDIFQQQQLALQRLFHIYKGAIVLILLYLITQFWQYNSAGNAPNHLNNAADINLSNPRLLSFKIFTLTLAFSPLFFIFYQFRQKFLKLLNAESSDFSINRLLQISLIILHFYLLWVIISLQDLLVGIIKFFTNYLNINQLSTLSFWQAGCQVALFMSCIALIYLYIQHLRYLAPFKKDQKFIKKSNKGIEKINKSIKKG